MNSETVNVLWEVNNTYKYKGIFIDLFRCWEEKRYEYEYKLNQIKSNSHYSKFKKNKAIRELLLSVFYAIKQCWYGFLNLFSKKDKMYATDPIMQQASFKKAWFLPLSSMNFRGRACSVPKDWENFLVKRYGDWKKIPPKKDRRAHHGDVKIW